MMLRCWLAGHDFGPTTAAEPMLLSDAPLITCWQWTELRSCSRCGNDGVVTVTYPGRLVDRITIRLTAEGQEYKDPDTGEWRPMTTDTIGSPWPRMVG
jgi:hypothetical protein